MANKGWLVLLVVSIGALLATLNVARHPHLSHLAFYEDAHELRQHSQRLRRGGAGFGAAAAPKAAATPANGEHVIGAADAVGAVAAAAARDTVVAAPMSLPQADAAAAGATDTAGAAEPAAAAATSRHASAAAGQRAAVAAGADAPLTAAAPATEGGPAAEEAEDPETQAQLSQRVCGSPAVDGYAHVKPECLVASPAAKWWKAWEAGGGRREDLVVFIENRADYDGLAVAWGIGHTKASVEACAEACRAHKANPSGSQYEPLPCNAFSFCMPEEGESCFEPDAHKHTKGDCWLKFTEGPAAPEINMRGKIRPEMRARHATAPQFVQWHSGVLLPKGARLTNGTWSPRYEW